MATLYKCTYFVKDIDGRELSSKEKYFSNRQKAMDYLFKITSEEFDKTLDEYLYPDALNLYTHIIRYEDREGEYTRVASAIYSYSESTEYNGESCRTTVCNENKPVFKTI